MTSTIPSTRGTRSSANADNPDLVEMAWDPITRIVGSLGIYTKIDFKQRTVAECHSTSSIFRGYSIFMKGKDPRDAHFITSRICGICGDNHATCSCYAQNMAYGVKPPHLGEWIVNLGEAAEYMFDHNIFQENLVGVDYCEKMVSETNPGVLEKANNTEAPHAGEHGYRTIGDIMRSLNPFTGEFYREALQVSRYTREMFCLMEGRHVHPSTLYPGGVGTVATIQLMTDYMTRLMRYIEFIKKVVPMHDDLFDFFYEALPGYEQVGLRRTLLGCWGSFQDPEHCNFEYKDMTNWGRKMYVTPGVVVDGKLVTTDLVEINLGIRILLGSSYYDDWTEQEMFVKNDPLGNPVDRRHPWNQHTNPKPQKRDLDDKYSWVMSPRWYDGQDYLALDTGGGPLARLWSTALAGLVDIGYVKSTGSSVQINLPKTALKGPVSFEWKIPQWSNTLERNRARTYFQAYAAAAALHFAEKALVEIRAGRTKTWEKFEVPNEGIGCGFTEAVRGVLSHHMVIRDGKIANYHPYPPTPWNANPRDSYGTPGPYEDAVQGQPIFEENDREHFKGIDIMRTVRSFDPCLPCGVHMYLGGGKKLERMHSPTEYVAATERQGHTMGLTPKGSSTTPSLGLHETGERINTLLEASAAGGVVARERAEELVRLVADLYGAGLERVLTILHEGGHLDDDMLAALAGDDLVSSLLLVHNLHPYDVQTRVEQALEGVRPYLGSHGGDVELLEVTEDDVVRLRLLGSCDGCASSSVTLKLAVEGAIEARRPEIVGIEVETPTESASVAAGPVISVDSLWSRVGDSRTDGGPSWQAVPELAGLADGEVTQLRRDRSPSWAAAWARTCTRSWTVADSAKRCWPGPPWAGSSAAPWATPRCGAPAAGPTSRSAGPASAWSARSCT